MDKNDYYNKPDTVALTLKFYREELDRIITYKESINNNEPLAAFFDSLVRQAEADRG
jgi:hypothetical protein